jgi:hypothetical protein
MKIFEQYSPKELKKEELVDYRYNKELPWSSSCYKLKFPQFYSKELLDIFNKYMKAVYEYLEGNYLTEVTKKYKTSVRITQRVAQELITGISMEKILRSIIRNKGKLGLELAASELKIYFHENQKLPICNDDSMIIIRNAILTYKYWSKFNVKCWNDMLEYAYGEELVKELKRLEEQEKFNKVISELEDFYNKNGRLPLYEDKELKWIAGSVSRGAWIIFGIKTWNDLLKYVFGIVNLEHNLYKGIEGFNKAVKELKDFYNKTKKLPTIKECATIAGAVHRGVWVEFDIHKWNDMMTYVFGKVNLNIENDFSRKDSLEIAQRQLREFRDKNGRLPTAKDGKIHSIWRAAKRGVWKDLGIETWNDLFIITFGVSAIERYKYVGKKGLERAIKEIKDYKKKMKKNPSVPEMDSIYRAIKKGNWKKYGINCWNDILYIAIGEVNVERKDYKGKKGLEKAIKELKTFKDKTGQFPTTKNQGMWNIAYAVRQGEWKQFGISNWYDLLKIVFKDIKIERDKYKGKEGLDNAVQALRDFEKSSGRKPTSKDVGMRNIQNAIWRGVWKELGVNYWNDLFKVAFGVNNVRRSRSKYKGKEALNRAVQTLKDFEQIIPKTYSIFFPNSTTNCILNVSHTYIFRCRFSYHIILNIF